MDMAQVFVHSPGKFVIRNAADVTDIVDAGIDHSDPVAQRQARRKTLLVMAIAPELALEAECELAATLGLSGRSSLLRSLEL